MIYIIRGSGGWVYQLLFSLMSFFIVEESNPISNSIPKYTIFLHLQYNFKGLKVINK